MSVSGITKSVCRGGRLRPTREQSERVTVGIVRLLLSSAALIARFACPGLHFSSQLPPDVFEIVEALLSNQPFGGADCAFGEAAA